MKVIFEAHKLIIMLPVGGVMAFIFWFCFSLGVNGSQYVNPSRFFNLLLEEVLDTLFSSQADRVGER